MRIMGINPGTSPRFAPLMQERILMTVRNNSGATATEGGAACYDIGGTTYTDSVGTRQFGYDVDKPATANLEFWLGMFTREVAAGDFGEIHIFGYMDNALVNRAGAGDPDIGDAVFPVNAQWYLDPGTPDTANAADRCWAADPDAYMTAIGTGAINCAVFLMMGAIGATV